MIRQTRWSLGFDDLAIEANVPIWIEFPPGVDLKSVGDNADCYWKKVRAWSCQEID